MHYGPTTIYIQSSTHSGCIPAANPKLISRINQSINHFLAADNKRMGADNKTPLFPLAAPNSQTRWRSNVGQVRPSSLLRLSG